MAHTRQSDRGHRLMLGAVGLILFISAALSSNVQAEKMDLGKIPKEQLKGWCGAHNGQYLDWGGAGSTCTTDTGAAVVCDNKDNCTGFPPKPAKMTGQQPGIVAFPELRMGGTRTPIMGRGIEADPANASTDESAMVETGRIECAQSGNGAACFCSGKVDCEIMKAKVCNPQTQTCQTANGTDTCTCRVRD